MGSCTACTGQCIRIVLTVYQEHAQDSLCDLCAYLGPGCCSALFQGGACVCYIVQVVVLIAVVTMDFSHIFNREGIGGIVVKRASLVYFIFSVAAAVVGFNFASTGNFLNYLFRYPFPLFSSLDLRRPTLL